MKKSIIGAAVFALVMSAAAVSITPTDVTINGSANTLYPHYEISGANPDCNGIIVRIYDAARTIQYGEIQYPYPELLTTGSHSLGLSLDGTGLIADKVEDGEPSIYIELSVVDFCTITESGHQVLASSGIDYGSSGSSSSSSSGGGGLTVRHYQKAQILTGVAWADDGIAVLSIKTGTFKGSFKVYAVQNGKLKKYTAKVTGLVVNGTGFGTATVNGTRLYVEID